MGFMSNTVSVYQYTVKGDHNQGDLGEWVRLCLEKNRLVPATSYWTIKKAYRFMAWS